MAKKGIPILGGFMLGSKSYLDTRKSVADIAELRATDVNIVPEGFISYVREEDKYYKFNSSVSEDPALGYWRETNITGHPAPKVVNKTLIL